MSREFVRALVALSIVNTACGSDTSGTSGATTAGAAGDTSEDGSTPIIGGRPTTTPGTGTKGFTGGTGAASTSPTAGGSESGGQSSVFTVSTGGANVGGATAGTGGAVSYSTATTATGGSIGDVGVGGAGGATPPAAGGYTPKGGTTSVGGTSTQMGGATTTTTAANAGTTSTSTGMTCATSYYRDADNDSWGSNVKSCTGGAGWVTKTGDCNDGSADVFPGQTSTFAVGYTVTGGATSFDYNCDGQETSAGSIHESPGTCTASTGGASCTGEGYLPTVPPRTGNGINSLCGSTRYLVCSRVQQQCISAMSTDGTYDAVSCR